MRKKGIKRKTFKSVVLQDNTFHPSVYSYSIEGPGPQSITKTADHYSDLDESIKSREGHRYSELTE